MELVADLLTGFDPETPHFRPGDIYRKGWLLRAFLSQFAQHRGEDSPFAFAPGASWFCGVSLPTPFQARYRGDPHAADKEHADGVIGHVLINSWEGADLQLTADATQFVVVEARIRTPLSSGPSNAPYLDEVSRDIVCIAELLRRTDRSPAEMADLALVVLAGRDEIDRGQFSDEMRRARIRSNVDRKVAAYQGALDEWKREWFEPTMAEIELRLLSWEAGFEWLAVHDQATADSMRAFYALCQETA